MKIAVVTDNLYLLGCFRRIASKNGGFISSVDYYCSLQSSNMFENEVDVESVSLREDWKRMANNYDLLFSLHCKQIFPRELVEQVTCVNIHPGLNPYNRGWFPQVFAINNGMPHGATIHLMDEEIDHGAIIAQSKVDIFEHDTSKSVYERVVNEEIKLLDQNFNKIIKKQYQAEMMSSVGNYNGIKDFNEICHIDMNKQGTFRDFYNLLRSLTHDPYNNAYFYDCNGNKVFMSLNIEVEKLE